MGRLFPNTPKKPFGLMDEEEFQLPEPEPQSRLFSWMQPPKLNETPPPPTKGSTMDVKPETPGAPEIDPSTGEPRKKGWSLKKAWSGEEPTGKKDEFDLDVPEKKKTGIGGKLLASILPALFGFAGGAGIVPGMMAGFARKDAQDEMDFQTRNEAYQKQRDALIKANQPTNLEREIGVASKWGDEQWKIYNKIQSAKNPLGWAGLSATESYRQQQLELDRLRLEMQERERADKAAKEAQPKPLSADAAKTLEISRGGLANVKTFREKLKGGSNLLLPELFDRDLAAIRDDLKDRIGRLRSGGAIGKDEEGNFLGQIPSFMDLQLGGPEVVENKLKRLEEMFSNIETLMTPQTPPAPQGGAAPPYKPLKKSPPKSGGGTPQPVQASEDLTALQWAKQNPNDPRAKEILKVNGL